jgi:hypothetical protein
MSPNAAPPKPQTETSDATLATFEKAVRLYAEMGFSAERAALTLARTGYAIDLIRARFPDVPANIIADALRVEPRTEAKTQRGRGGLQPLAVRAPDALLPAHPRVTAPPTARAPSLPATPTPAVAPAPIESAAPTAPLSIDTDPISFQYVPLIQCSFPHADPGEQSTFTRRNGWLELTLATARRDFGLPYGVPARLLTIYFASEAVRTKSPEIYLGDSVNDFLRRLDVPITRGARGSQRVYANQLLRLIHCAVSIDENVRDGAGRAGLHIRQALFAEEARLWWDQDGVGQGSSLVLSSVLFDSILERSAPLSTAAIKQLRKSPMDLDVYAWLVHRLFSLSSMTTITWAQLSGQFGHGYSEPRTFRRFFLDSLKRVLAVYPEARAKPTATGLQLAPSRPHVARAALTAKR